MGIPKFYRWVSERYPCLSEVVRDYQIPDFDNLYLDMNGIIHLCSHPNDDDPFFRITEEKIFKDIFHYIEVLFRIVKPRKVFFMAVDGVAPRAKMNQQRGRRFRSAKEAATNEAKAVADGKELPKEARFDSNCITPGTDFMERLDQQLRFFIAGKISKDKLWQGLRVFLSGHETPGEGEHKIMDFIRFEKSRDDYDPNTKHCLYGLDADLIMLGLCSHEPHFSLLREEVKFNFPKKKGGGGGGGRTAVPEETTFHLLHLSLMREYMEMEFSPLKDVLPFRFDLECIIDDWILIGFLVGNDFIPHLPDLHIKHEALPKLWKVYMDVLPELDGYINEGGNLNLRRFQQYMAALSTLEYKLFMEKYADLKYLESKTGKQLTSYELEGDDDGLGAEFEALRCDDPEPRPAFSFQNFDKEKIKQLLKEDGEDESDDLLNDPDFLKTFRDYKNKYYAEKMKLEPTPEVLKEQAYGYVRALQWNLHYYYHGVASWSWFFPHHYSPYISDVTNFGGLDLEFDMSEPFLPFQQLLAVLPPGSKTHVPESYHWLMEAEESPIIDFYPPDFGTDLNGKSQDWEAVVLIPFIDEKKLLSAMKICETGLSDEERSRNKHSPAYLFEYTSDDLGIYPAPAYFSQIEVNHAKLTRVHPREWLIPRDKLVRGLCKGVSLDVYFPGFPTFKQLNFSFNLERAQVRVFQSNSRSENMVLSLQSVEVRNARKLAEQMIGTSVYVHWPHMVEAVVESISTSQTKFVRNTNGEGIWERPSSDRSMPGWDSRASAIEERHMTKFGIKIGETEVLVQAKPVVGRVYASDNRGNVIIEKVYAEQPQDFALQTVVRQLKVQLPALKEYTTIEDLYPVGSEVFLLCLDGYGRKCTVIAHELPRARVKVRMQDYKEFCATGAKVVEQSPAEEPYFHASQIGMQINMKTHVVSRITGTIFLGITTSGSERSGASESRGRNGGPKLNVGLNLKLNKKNTEAVGFAKRTPEGGWLYSASTADLLRQYMDRWPEVIDHITRSTGDDVYNDTDIFKRDTAEKVDELKAWLEALPCYTADRQTCGAPKVPMTMIKTLDEAVQKWRATIDESKTVRVSVKPQFVYRPNEYQGAMLPDPGTKFSLYDRVVNVRDSFTVPLGEKGFVIGVIPGLKEEDTLYEVVFDRPFPGGLSGDRFCGVERGYRMHGNSLLSITWGVEKWNGDRKKATGGGEVSSPQQNAWNRPLQNTFDRDERRQTYQQFQAPPASEVPKFDPRQDRRNESQVRHAPPASAVPNFNQRQDRRSEQKPRNNGQRPPRLANDTGSKRDALDSRSRRGKQNGVEGQKQITILRKGTTDITEHFMKLSSPSASHGTQQIEIPEPDSIQKLLPIPRGVDGQSISLFPDPPKLSNMPLSSTSALMPESLTVDQLFQLVKSPMKPTQPPPAVVPVRDVESLKSTKTAEATLKEFFDHQGFQVQAFKMGKQEDGQFVASFVMPSGKKIVGPAMMTPEDAKECAYRMAVAELGLVCAPPPSAVSEPVPTPSAPPLKLPFPKPPPVPHNLFSAPPPPSACPLPGDLLPGLPLQNGSHPPSSARKVPPSPAKPVGMESESPRQSPAPLPGLLQALLTQPAPHLLKDGDASAIDVSRPPPSAPAPAPSTPTSGPRGKYMDDLEEVFQTSPPAQTGVSTSAGSPTPSNVDTSVSSTASEMKTKVPSAFVPLQVMKLTRSKSPQLLSSPPPAASSPLSDRERGMSATSLDTSKTDVSIVSGSDSPRPDAVDLRPQMPRKSRLAINFKSLSKA